MRKALLVAALLVPQIATAQDNGGAPKLYIGTYAKSILILDEPTLKIQDSLKVSVGVPVGMTVSSDRTKMYVMDPGFEHVEVFDLATRKAIDKFTLSEGNKRVRMFGGFNVDPKNRFAIMVVKTYTKKVDRFEVSAPKMLKYDLAKHQVTDTIPWPRGEERDGARILFSQNGDLLYFFTNDDVLIYDANTLKQVDRWEIAQPVEEGMGRLNFGFPIDVYEEPGYHTGLFRVTDPVQNRTLMGVARVNLEQRSFEFYTLGPSMGVGFALAPDRRRAYGLRQEVGNYEFWTFDLANRRVSNRVQFAGRPRMQLTASSNNRYVYVHGAGNTIDVRDANTFQLVRVVPIDGDMTGFRLVR